MVKHYIGRFAPSPSGALHFGSLVAAMASYLDARQNRGMWMLRFDDIDETRTVPGAADTILRQLVHFGFKWDGDIFYQTQQKDRYQSALDQLQGKQLVYPCACTRAEIAAHGDMGAEGTIYPGTCRKGLTGDAVGRSLRIKTDSAPIIFKDRIAGSYTQNISQEIGDFIIRRTDGFFAYQLAVVLDDVRQGITHIVRGADLLASTPRQLYLQKLLGISTPIYAHIPLVLDASGRKLSKSDADRPIDGDTVIDTLREAWDFLIPSIQSPLEISSMASFWDWAISNWRISLVCRGNEAQPQIPGNAGDQ